MTRDAAIRKAKRLARETGTTHYVIWDHDDCGDTVYHVADQEAMDTFYLSFEADLAVEPDGVVSR
jgi:hypothetical protein